MRNKIKHKLNNNGYALVFVIIVVTFVTILATTLLYISGINYQMKAVDYSVKENFYESEVYLERVKAELTTIAADASAHAYQETMVEAAQIGFSDGMQAKFNEKYFAYIKSQWTAISAVLVDGVCYADALSDDDRWIEHVDQGYMELKGFHVHYTDAKGYTSLIDTDFMIKAPTINWPVSEAKQSWNSADAGNLPEQINYSECVTYKNWIKK